jgi:hypothetical protein
MREKLNLPGSLNRSVAKNLRIPQVPMEWMDAASWRLPSGKALAEFALQAGFLAPLFLDAKPFGLRSRDRSSGPGELPAPPKHAGKAGPR